MSDPDKKNPIITIVFVFNIYCPSKKLPSKLYKTKNNLWSDHVENVSLFFRGVGFEICHSQPGSVKHLENVIAARLTYAAILNDHNAISVLFQGRGGIRG